MSNIINLILPSTAVLKGRLYESYDQRNLDQDILEVDLDTGLTIEVGWYPEYDPNGSFRITVFRDHWVNQIGRPITVKTTYQVAEAVEFLAKRYSAPLSMWFVSCTQETQLTPGHFQSDPSKYHVRVG